MMTDLSIVKRYIRMANDGWLQGWHERNGGNLTYRLTKEEVAEMRPFFDARPREWVPMGVTGANLAGEYFLATGSGNDEGRCGGNIEGVGAVTAGADDIHQAGGVGQLDLA